jgi:hypothetical protein
MDNCLQCPYREKYTFICKHPNIICISLTRRNGIPDWCPFKQEDSQYMPEGTYSGGEWWFF